jgi:hypothetical protein
MAQGPNMGFVGQTQKVAGGGGYNPSAFGRGVEGAQAAFREPGEFLSQLGDGSEAMGAGRLGLTGLGVAGQQGHLILNLLILDQEKKKDMILLVDLI